MGRKQGFWLAGDDDQGQGKFYAVGEVDDNWQAAENLWE